MQFRYGSRRQWLENETRAGGLLGGGTVDDRGFGMMKGRFRMLIRSNVVLLLLLPSIPRPPNLKLYPYRLPCFPSHLSMPYTSLPSQILILIYPTTTPNNKPT